MIVNELLNQEYIQEVVGAEQLLEQVVVDLCYDSRLAKVDTVFFALQGKTSDGAAYIDMAYAQGCRVFVAQRLVVVPKDALLIIVNNARLALSYAAHVFFGKPSESLKVIGITGTKGKTTTTTMLYQVLTKHGLKAGVIGTNGIYFKEIFLKTANTTPESYELHKVMRQMLDAGVTTCFMEVSSQGLMMKRVEHIAFDLAVFTNMAVDHIGELEHPTFDDYLYWKTYLFTLTKMSLLNRDDAYMDRFDLPNVESFTYGLTEAATYSAKAIEHVFTSEEVGMVFDVAIRQTVKRVRMQSPGIFNVYNGLVVIAVADLLGLSIDGVIESLTDVTVSGRMEFIANNKGVMAVLDYAHNGFSLENVVETLKHYPHKRLLILFGSVGERSQGRRQELGEIVAKHADVAMITSDNPGHEDPMAIIEDIAQEFIGKSCVVYKEPDRKIAIEKMVSVAKEGDIVLFAGKGHETYQLIGSEKVAFHEKEIIQQAFL